MVTLYSTHCPKCNVLKSKLQASGIEFEECVDIKKMSDMGMMQAPMLDTGDGKPIGFSAAVKWVNEYASAAV